jgi:hypothetical protein
LGVTDILPDCLLSTFITPVTGPRPFLLALSYARESLVILPSAQNVKARSTFQTNDWLKDASKQTKTHRSN